MEEKRHDAHSHTKNRVRYAYHYADAITYETDGQKRMAPPFHINGLRDKFCFIRHSGTVCCYGLSFHAFGLYPFVNQSLACIQNSIYDLYNLSMPLATKLEGITANGSFADFIEEVLCSEMRISSGYMNKARLISDYINMDGDISIQAFCVKRGINIKTFERMVLRHTGYAPKVLRRVRRFQTASNQLVHQSPIALADIAYGNRFTDQSHFTHDFRKLSGAAPRLFQQEKATLKENVKYVYE